MMTSEFPSVIDLPADHGNPLTVVEAVISAGTELVASPIHPPMCPQASVAIDAESRLVLVAVAKQGLSDLKLIGRAYQWLIENRGLVAMALPTIRVDAMALPRLSLLVDQVDLSADLLQPLMMTGSVTVHAYRKLRWGDRVGMLLEAA